MYKKFTAITIALFMILALAACGAAEIPEENTAPAAEEETAPAESGEAREEGQKQEESPEEETAEPEETPDPDSEADVGASGIEILEPSAENTELESGTVTVTIGRKELTLNGAYVVDGTDAVITGGTYESSESDQNVFLVVNGGSLTLTGAEIVKTGDAGPPTYPTTTTFTA